MNEYKFTDMKKTCIFLAFFFWGFPLFCELFGNTISVKLFPRELLVEYIDPVFYGVFFLLLVVAFRKMLVNNIKNFVKEYERYLRLSAVFAFITLILMVVSAIVLDSVGVGESSNQELIDEAIVQYGLLQIITVCFWGPVVEEVFYRGILFECFGGKKNRVIGSIIAVLLTSLLFAFMHVSIVEFSLSDLLANIPILMLGLSLATLRWKTDNILCSILVHIIINSIATFG